MGAHGDTPLGARGSALAAFYLNLLGHGAGWLSPPRRGSAPRGRAPRLPARSWWRRPDRVRVERVITAAGRVRGVGVADGEELPASLVLADVMPHALLALCGDALTGWYRRLLLGYRYGPATVKLDWALDGPIPWTAPDARRAGTVHVGGDETSTRTALDGARHGLPERPFLLLGQQSLADATRAPAGQHTAWAYTHGPSAVRERLTSERCVQAATAQVERFAPGFRDRILATHVLGPDALQARNANLVHGDVGGGSYSGRPQVFRPLSSALALPDAAGRAVLGELGRVPRRRRARCS